jgi:hypothetical protein
MKDLTDIFIFTIFIILSFEFNVRYYVERHVSPRCQFYFQLSLSNKCYCMCLRLFCYKFVSCVLFYFFDELHRCSWKWRFLVLLLLRFNKQQLLISLSDNVLNLNLFTFSYVCNNSGNYR